MPYQTREWISLNVKSYKSMKENMILVHRIFFFLGRKWNLCWSNCFISLWSFGVLKFFLPSIFPCNKPIDELFYLSLFEKYFSCHFYPAINFNFSLSHGTCVSPFTVIVLIWPTDREFIWHQYRSWKTLSVIYISEIE